jgi:hypothetical protein
MGLLPLWRRGEHVATNKQAALLVLVVVDLMVVLDTTVVKTWPCPRSSGSALLLDIRPPARH